MEQSTLERAPKPHGTVAASACGVAGARYMIIDSEGGALHLGIFVRTGPSGSVGWWPIKVVPYSSPLQLIALAMEMMGRVASDLATEMRE